MEITSWNRFSRRFIDAPVFEVTPRKGAVRYRMILRQGEEEYEVLADAPRPGDAPWIDANTVWPRIKPGRFTIRFEAFGPTGALAGASAETLRIKSLGWSGWDGERADWAAAADRNIAFLIHAAEHARAPYREPGVPAWVWTPTVPNAVSPEGRVHAYPALHMPLFIRAFLAHARAGRPHAAAAERLARVCGEWMLSHRRPDSGALPQFPYSTITMGRYEGDKEIGAINLLRGATVGTALVALYNTTGHAAFLHYAEKIAKVMLPLQREDGSFPYRVNPESGAVVEDYTPHAIEFILLVEAIAAVRGDTRRAEAARRALEWTLAVPLPKHHWQAGFEDVGEWQPYSNLSNWAALDLIPYLCRHAAENPDFVPTARELNRWVEDQFVIFGPDESLPIRTHAPMVIEQYACYWPMECHTARWLLALLALHGATGEDVYLEKAQAAGNAICASQYDDGAFATFPMDADTGRPATEYGHWYGCNAPAAEALYILDQYVRG